MGKEALPSPMITLLLLLLLHDMTKTEREECKRLVSEAKSMTEDEDSGDTRTGCEAFRGR